MVFNQETGSATAFTQSTEKKHDVNKENMWFLIWYIDITGFKMKNIKLVNDSYCEYIIRKQAFWGIKCI